uniref:Protein kinase domain-containing protein n=1 Tax=Timema bartmani TaxID=61472 RepID=A0A7R9EZ37_9NEOP|nr:unnamed protein product [Timema bartmani]
MQYAKNGDVFEYMLKNGALDEDLARYWFRQLSLALQYLHKLGITHRDLKCENALITEKYNVKLSDFSFARYTFDNKGAPALSNTFCGSFPYISPEIIRGRLYDPKCADVWALGVLLFIMLNKSLPYSESNMKKLYEKQMKQDWHFRSKRAPLLSEEVKYLVRRMLTPKCSNRLDIDSVVNSDWVMKDSNIKILAPDEQKALDEAITLRSDKSYIQSSTGPMTARKKVKVDGAQMSKNLLGRRSFTGQVYIRLACGRGFLYTRTVGPYSVNGTECWSEDVAARGLSCLYLARTRGIDPERSWRSAMYVDRKCHVSFEIDTGSEVEVVGAGI